MRVPFLLLLLPLLLDGCMANSTRSQPVTELPLAAPTGARPFQGRSLDLRLDLGGMKVEGGHHEGLMQVRQPWIFGLTKEQRATLYGQAGPVAVLAFATELKRLGARVEEGTPELELRGRLRTVVLNTYGKGTKEGFGSAGDYWEATVKFEGLELRDRRSGALLWAGPLEEYAKARPCPASLDWDLLTLSVKILSSSVALQTVATGGVAAIGAGKDYVQTFAADYTLDRTQVSPIEVAGRKAAQHFLALTAAPAHP